MATAEIGLGYKIEVSHFLKRVSEYRQDNKINEYRKTHFKEWHELDFKTPKKVIIIGVRTLSNGYAVWEEDVGNIYYQLTHFSALLVVENLRSKPFYILNDFK